MVLYYYDDPNDVGTLKGSLDLDSIRSITQESRAKDETHYELVGKTTDGEAATWAIKFVEDEPRAVVEMWKRKISRSCHYITGTNAFPTDIASGSAPRPALGNRNASMLGSFAGSHSKSGHASEVHSVNAVRRLSTATLEHKGGAKKRSSIFGR